MWPFHHIRDFLNRPADALLTSEQAERVVRIFYREHDINCWYACASFSEDDGVRLAVSSKKEAFATAQELGEEVFRKTGRRVPAQED